MLLQEILVKKPILRSGTEAHWTVINLLHSTWERLTKDDKADEDDVYCELPDGSLDVPFPVEIIQKACYIFCLISHPERIPFNRVLHIFGGPKGCEGLAKCSPTSLRFNMIIKKPQRGFLDITKQEQNREQERPNG